MKYVPRMPIPWDMVVFLTITTAGFGFSVHKVLTQEELGFSPERQIALVTPSGTGTASTTRDLGCLERSLPRQRLQGELGIVRLRGRFCHLTSQAMRSFEGVQIRNRTNGFEGTVFFQGYDASFVTDQVALAPGRNEIEIEWRERADLPIKRIVAEVYHR